MTIFTCIIFIVLVCGTSFISLVYSWRRRGYRSIFVQLVVVIFTMAGGIYAIIQYPDIFSIAKAFNYLSPLN
jgi:hypothetical protein